MGFPGGSDSKELPAMQDIWVQSLGWEDPLEEEAATYFSILTWRIPWTEEPAGLQSTGSHKSRTRLSETLPTPHLSEKIFLFCRLA